MNKPRVNPAKPSSDEPPRAKPAAFAGVIRADVKVLKPGLDPVKAVRRLRDE